MKDESKFNNHTDSMTEMISEQYELDIKNKRLIEENDQLTSMVDELQARLEAQRTYRAMLAHEIGTPLTLIQGYLQLVEDGAVDPTTHPYHKLAVEKVGMLSRLVGELQELSVIEKQEAMVRLERMNVSDWLKRIERLGSFMVEQSGRIFRWNVFGRPQKRSRCFYGFFSDGSGVPEFIV